jgi:hypothetical protein
MNPNSAAKDIPLNMLLLRFSRPHDNNITNRVFDN